MILHISLISREVQQRMVATLLLLVALCCVVPLASASRIAPSKYAGIVASIDYKTKTIIFQLGSDGKDFQLSWYWDTTFIENGKRTKADALKPGTPVKVEYHIPIFGRQYISRIEWNSKSEQGNAATGVGR